MRNGAALRTCHRISSSRSRARAGTFSNRSRDTLATLSGMASATRFGRAPIRSNTRRSAAATAFGSAMLVAFSDGMTAPGGQRLDGVRGDRQPGVAGGDGRGRHPMPRDFDRNGGRRRATGMIYSTKVTLLISRSVVVPCSTFSTADSRRNRMPSSCASFLDFG